ncbi:DeoR/GlpR family DNA-binding transcription regulator [Schumannella soli]|uniref:Lactose phosphotransferase system repressor n=1 Tax=Schumannella soli TaxID=2590779 RepID=A0A506Y0R5_9MICO|nr:DeoR/GlpR family DNA-binding transcription regulator [Schumannella soli]TPW75483.1 DeoR/GlpR transcriptional regulator [Schumannella soli]
MAASDRIDPAARPVAARREQLTALVAERGFVRVADAAVELGVSTVTLRGDLEALAADGLLRRVHGGAMPPVPEHRESSMELSSERQSAVKRAIARRAAALVAPGTSVLLDVGSTTLAVAEALVERTELTDVVVITNGLSVALALERAIPRLDVIVTGGTLRPLQHSLVNPVAASTLEGLHADLAIIGCTGVDRSGRVTNVNLPEAEVKRAMLGAADRAVLVADGSKLGVTHLGRVGALADFEALVTGGEVADAAVLDSVREAGCRLLAVDARG